MILVQKPPNFKISLLDHQINNSSLKITQMAESCKPAYNQGFSNREKSSNCFQRKLVLINEDLFLF